MASNGMAHLCSTESLIGQQDVKASSQRGGSVPRAHVGMWEVSWGLELEMVHHVHHILVLKASQLSRDSRNKKTDSTFPWAKLQNQAAKSWETQKGGNWGILTSNPPHPSKYSFSTLTLIFEWTTSIESHARYPLANERAEAGKILARRETVSLCPGFLRPAAYLDQRLVFPWCASIEETRHQRGLRSVWTVELWSIFLVDIFGGEESFYINLKGMKE